MSGGGMCMSLINSGATRLSAPNRPSLSCITCYVAGTSSSGGFVVLKLR